MPRPPQPPNSDELTPDELVAYEHVLAARTRGASSEPFGEDYGTGVGVYWSALLNWPAYAANRVELSSLVRTAGERSGTYSHADREWVDQVLSVHLHTNVVQPLHLPDALGAGVRLEAIEALFKGDDDALTDDERFLKEYIIQVVDGALTDENWDRMVRRLGRRGATEYTIFITVLLLTIRQFQAFGCEDPTQSEIDALLQTLKEGARDTSDWRSRIA